MLRPLLYLGMIAGFLSRFGKIGVIIGFITGNILLSYVSNGNTVPIIYLKEIIVASLGLLLVPKKIDINIQDFFGKDLYLPVGKPLGLETAESTENTIDKLNTVSETINEMSRGYREEGFDTKEDNDNKNTFTQNLLDKLDSIKENVLYEDLQDEENGLISDIFDSLEEKDEITKDDILKLLEKRNEYVIGFDDFDTNLKIEEDINIACRLINDTYKIGKVNDIWKKKIKESKKVISSQLDGVTRAITDVAKSINKEKNNNEEERQDKFSLQIGVATHKKDGAEVSGDSNLQTKLDDGKYLIALSDGMGSGVNARRSSQIAIKMLNRLLSSGFDKDTSLELINTSMYINSKEDSYATLDIAILDLYTGKMEFMKNGACPTFIKNNKNVNVVKSVSLPAGILDQVDLVVYDKDLADGDIIVMCTDGILESNLEYENKEIWVKNLLEEIETDNAQRIADILLAQSVDNGVGVAKDDMTVVAVKVKKI